MEFVNLNTLETLEFEIICPCCLLVLFWDRGDELFVGLIFLEPYGKKMRFDY